MNPTRPAPKQTRSAVSAIVLAVGLALSTTAAIFAFRAFDADEAQRFSEAVDEIHSELQGRLDFFANSIRQLAAIYAINPHLSQQAFLDYTNSTGIRSNDRGIFSYGIFELKQGPTADRDRYVLALREIGPNAPTRLVPLGTDVSSERERVELFREAIRSAQTVLSARVPDLVHRQTHGQMMTAAAYRGNRIPKTPEAREKAAIGVAYARFSESGLFDQVLNGPSSYKARLAFQIFDAPIDVAVGGKLKPLYEHVRPSTEPERSLLRTSTFEIDVGRRRFTVRVLSSGSPFASPAGLIALLILATGVALSLLVFRVIRQRELRSLRLLKSERQLKLVTDSLPVLIAYVDDTFTYRFNNRVYEDVFQRPRSEITGHKVQEILGEADWAQLRPGFEQAMKGERVELDWTLKQPDGRVSQYHQLILPDTNHRGEVKGVIAMHTDITERAKRQENAQFLGEISRILATSLDPLVIANKLVHKLLRLCDWCVIELFGDDGHVEHRLWSASTTERLEGAKRLPALGEDELRSLGATSTVSIPLRTGDRALGTLSFYSGEKSRVYTSEDVRYFEEIALRSSLAFENARLYAQSQNLNRAKDHFLAMLSHELRTPMNVILGWLEILATEELDDETYEQALETLNRNAKVQIQLINDLLDVSRVINGKLSLHATKTNLGPIATGAVDSVRPASRAKNIEVKISTEGDLHASVDSERIQQVLWNLLSNAVKFTPNGGQIRVRVVGDQQTIRFVVSDSGIGIEAGFLPFVFDRFRQEEEGGFTRSQGGLGLGLSIVRYIVEGHGGTIEVTSPGRNQGTTFTVVLPKIAQIPGDLHLTPSAP
jgi:PAS domain S-box-containing protein